MARGGSREKVAILERQLLALDLRKQGYSYRQIAKRLEISLGLAYKYIQDELDALAQMKSESADGIRQLELERIDMLMKGLAPMAQVGHIGAVNAYLNCMERRAKLLGLDAPVKQENQDKLEIIIRRENDNAAYSVPAPGRNIKQPSKVQSNRHRAARGQDDTGETVH